MVKTVRLFDHVEIIDSKDKDLIGTRHMVTAVVPGYIDMYKLDSSERLWLGSCLKVVKK